MILELKNISKEYKIYAREKQRVLHDINLSFKMGELVAILGESGSGKSTLMNIIGGMDLDYQGDVFYLNKKLKNKKEVNLDDYRKNCIGFVFQSFNLLSHLSVLENITIAMQMTRVSRKEREKRARKILSELGLENHLYKRPNQLSGGQKQRVAIARALANNPDIILADEPTGSLDKKNSSQILEIFEKIAKEGKLVILVTHSQKVADVANRIIQVEDGKVIADKVIEKVTDNFDLPAKPKTKPINIFVTLKMALKNIKQNLKRNLLVAIGGSVGILSVILMLAIGDGVKQFISDEVNATIDPKSLEISKIDLSQMNLTAEEIRNNNFNDEDVIKIKSIENVKDVKKLINLSFNTSVLYNGKRIELTQTSNLSDEITKDNIVAGSMPEVGEILINKSAAKELVGDEYFKIVGKNIKFYIQEINDDNAPLLIEKNFNIAGVYNDKNEKFMRGLNVALIDFDTLNSIYQNNNLKLRVNQLNVYVDDVDNTLKVKEAIIEKGYFNSSTADLLDQVLGYLDIATFILAGIAGISLIVSGIMILVVLYISVVERTREIGILRSFGARKQDVKNIFFFESGIIGFLSGIFAVVLAILLAKGVNEFLINKFEIDILHIKITFITFGMILSIFVSVIAGLLPASKAAKLDPMESLRYE